MGMLIEYLDLVPGKQHFACARLHATLSSVDCAARYEKSLNPNMRDDYVTCRGCPIGDMHAAPTNAAAPKWTPDTGQTCTRCGAGAQRMLPSSGLCVSCHNRWLEFRKGRNARGTACLNYIPPTERRVGIVKDGQPAWCVLPGQNATEPLARARRLGLEMHSERPGTTHWSPERQTFEYHDAHGRVLVELEVDGVLHFIGVDQLRADEVPAPVFGAAYEMQATELAVWLTLTGESNPLLNEWRSQPVLCTECRHAPLQARRRSGRVECRCGACGTNALF